MRIIKKSEWDKMIASGNDYADTMLPSTYEELKAKFPDKEIGKRCLLIGGDDGTCLIFEGLGFIVVDDKTGKRV